jgi:phage baseplate assembly protein W
MSNKYGNDVIIFDGDLAVSAKGDLLTATDYENTVGSLFEGYYNIIFSVFNRLNTVIGELPLHPDYGSNLPIIVSSPNNSAAIESVRKAFEDLLNSDSRVESVDLVNINQSGDKISVTANLLLTGRAESSVFVFPNFYIQ